MPQVVGPRNCGKTALIKYFLSGAREKGTLVVGGLPFVKSQAAATATFNRAAPLVQAHIDGRGKQMTPAVMSQLLQEQAANNLEKWKRIMSRAMAKVATTTLKLQGVDVSLESLFNRKISSINELIETYEQLLELYRKEKVWIAIR
jgi:predicted AAA+ superfamily ATPase